MGAESRFYRRALGRLTRLSRDLLARCRRTARDGTVLFTPDGAGGYGALWARDFAYMAEAGGDLMEEEEIGRCIVYLLRRQREDGWFPDRVDAAGCAVYAAGAAGSPVGGPNLDHAAFMVSAVSHYLPRLPEERARALLRVWGPALERGMAATPRSGSGLVFNSPAAPHSPYGFTDTVCKTGELLMESVLDWQAAKRLAALYRGAGGEERAAALLSAARAVERSLPRLYDEKSGAFFAASGDCRQIDIWGNAYLLYAGFPLAARVRERVESYLVSRRGEYLFHGQVRHLPAGEYWQKLLIPVAPGEYQNGAYWATAAGWVLWVLARRDPAAARAMLGELLDDFRQDVRECVNRGYRKLPQFVVSAVNVRGALLRLANDGATDGGLE